MFFQEISAFLESLSPRPESTINSPTSTTMSLPSWNQGPTGPMPIVQYQPIGYGPGPDQSGPPPQPPMSVQQQPQRTIIHPQPYNNNTISTNNNLTKEVCFMMI